MRRAAGVWLWVVLCLGGCAEEPGEPVEPVEVADAAAPGSDAVPAGLDLGAVVRQVQFAYRPDGDAFTGGHQAYGVKVGPQGRAPRTSAPRG